MTMLDISVDTAKKKLKFSGDKIALGEKILVKISGISDTSGLRLRVIMSGKTIAMFPANEQETWNGTSCELNLNTVQAGLTHCGYGVFVLDDPSADTLFGTGEFELLPWHREVGSDIPYDLGNYPDVIEEFRKEINDKFSEQDSEIESEIRNLESDYENAKTRLSEQQNKFEERVESEIANKANNDDLEGEAGARAKADTALSERISNAVTIIRTVEEKSEDNAKKIAGESESRASAIEVERQRALVAESSLNDKITAEKERAEEEERKINSRVGGVETSVRTVDLSVKNIKTSVENLRTLIDHIVNDAPETLDSFIEVAEYISKDKTAAQQMLASITQNKHDIKNALSLEKEQSFSDEEKSLASVNGGYRYLLNTPALNTETIDGKEYLKYEVKDYAINIIILDTPTGVRIYLPAPVDTTRRCRDFIIKLKVTSEEMPTVEFIKSEADASIGFEFDDEDWATIEAGINYFTFTETERE